MQRLRRGGVLLGVPVGVGLLALLLVGIWVASLGTDSRRAIEDDTAAAAPASGDGSVTLPDFPSVKDEVARVLTSRDETHRAAVWVGSVARKKPSADAPAVGRLSVKTPEETDNIVLALEERPDETGQLWVRVQVPVRANDRFGWVPRNSLGPYELIRTRLVVSRRHLRATLFSSGKQVFSAPIGIGVRGAPTPKGEFYIRNKLTKYANDFYGPLAFGTSARSPTLTDWPAGGYVGIHGTSRPDLLPGRVSHGCIRMANDDILRLARLIAPGTQLTIV